MARPAPEYGAPERAGAERRELDRIGPVIGVAVVHGLIGYALILGLGVAMPGALSRDSAAPIVISLTRPSPEAPPPHEPAGHGGAASAPAKPLPPKHVGASTPTQVVPSPVLPAPVPLVLVVPPVVTGGGENMDEAGEGGGSTGAGAGVGAGDGAGNGRGDGTGRGFSEARQIGGRFRNSDFPSSVHQAGRLRIGVRYAVGPTGRVVQCEIVETSGYSEVDAMTCRVIIDRYRFRPARDEDGVAITEVMEENYSWFTE